MRPESEQFFQPFIRLWCAVILQAVVDIEGPKRIAHFGKKGKIKTHERNHYKALELKFHCITAQEWIEDTACKRTSFQWICDQCDLDAKKIRSLTRTKEGRKKLLQLVKPKEGQDNAAE